MNKLLLGGAAAAFVVIAPAIAQPAPPAPVAPGTPQVQMHVRHMPMREQNRAEVVQHVRDMFGKLDTNRDGFVTREEADAGKHKMAGDMREHFAERLADHGADMPDRGAMFDKLDSNRDGNISRNEFMSAKPQFNERRVIVMRDGAGDPDGDGPMEIDGGPGAPHVKIMRTHGMGMGMGMHGKMFESADANRDGRVSLQEMTDKALQHFDTADANHDGKLTPEERMQMHQKHKAHRGQPA